MVRSVCRSCSNCLQHAGGVCSSVRTLSALMFSCHFRVLCLSSGCSAVNPLLCACCPDVTPSSAVTSLFSCHSLVLCLSLPSSAVIPLFCTGHPCFSCHYLVLFLSSDCSAVIPLFCACHSVVQLSIPCYVPVTPLFCTHSLVLHLSPPVQLSFPCSAHITTSSAVITLFCACRQVV